MGEPGGRITQHAENSLCHATRHRGSVTEDLTMRRHMTTWPEPPLVCWILLESSSPKIMWAQPQCTVEWKRNVWSRPEPGPEDTRQLPKDVSQTHASSNTVAWDLICALYLQPGIEARCSRGCSLYDKLVEMKKGQTWFIEMWGFRQGVAPTFSSDGWGSQWAELCGTRASLCVEEVTPNENRHRPKGNGE